MNADLTRLLRELAVSGVLRPPELLARLGVSKATLSRLIAAAGPEVLRLGRARATRYARAREVPGLGRVLPLFEVSAEGRASVHGRLHCLWADAHWLTREDGTEELYSNLPPALVDMAPQGYVGLGVPSRHPELGLPARVLDWSVDQQLIALARRGEDCVGSLIVGDESLARFLAHRPRPVDRADYPKLARASAEGEPGSSVGGEHPKFGAYVDGRHVLVKFASSEPSEVANRWRDLLWCEAKALEVLRAAGLTAASARVVDVEGWRFLEVERFDRIGERGRRGVTTLGALTDAYLGPRDSWTEAAGRLTAPGRLSLPASDARTIRWLDAFGQLIGNTDRHFGNLAFFTTEPAGPLTLAPAYDMLPMVLAPSATALVERSFTPAPPTSANLDVWPEAAASAVRYWGEVEAAGQLNPSVRAFAAEAGTKVQELASRLASPASRP